jgi:hypothetical protein
MDSLCGKDAERFMPARAALPYMQPCLNAHRATLKMQMHQLELLQSGKFRIGRRVLGDMAQENIARLTAWTSERIALIRALEMGAPI